MTRHSPLILIALVAYIYLPTFFAWITDTSNGWYRPFLIWILVVLGAYLLQKRNPEK